MTGEVEVYEAAPGRRPESDLERFAMDLTTAYQAARQLVTTSFVPKTYSGRPEEAAAAIMTGAEVGLSPLAALRSIDIINGVPAMRAVALRALVQAAGHEIWTEESTATQAIVAGRRKGSDQVERSVWTIDRAQGLGLMSKDNWRKQPIAMLLARSTSELVRLIAADVILGIPYSIEEVEDLGEVAASAEEAPRKAPARRTVKRSAAPASSEPELPGDEPKAVEALEPPADEPPAEDEVPPLALADPEPARDEESVREAARRAFEEPELPWGTEVEI